jgi:hypothetical protein
LAVLWWHQRNGEFDEFRQIAYDSSLTDATDEVEIPFADIALPYSENLICFRSCTDRALCACDGLPQIALASVVVAMDSDASGELSLEELKAEQVGGAEVLLGWAPVAQSGVPRGWDGIIDSAIAGFAVYRREEGSPLAPVTVSDAAYPVSFCPLGDRECALPLIHLLCHRDCERDWGLNRLGI